MTLDKLYIRDLLARCIVGVFPRERTKKQDVIINITLHADLRKACRTDRLEDSVDYKTVKEKVLALVEGSAFMLLERLAERIAEVCLEDRRVARVQVSVQKPGALRFARSSEVEIERAQRSGGAPGRTRPAQRGGRT